MKKLLTRTGIVIALLLPALAFAAYDDVTLTTDTILSVNSVSVNVSGSSATMETLVVDAGSFTATMQSGSTMVISAPNLSVTTEPAVGGLTTSCSGGVNTVTLPAVSGAVTVTVIPSATACNTTTTSSSSGGGPVGLVGSSGGGGGGGGGGGSNSYAAPAVVTAPAAVTPQASVSAGIFAKVTLPLKKGSTNKQVKTLQQMLNQDKDTQVSLSGVGSPGKETTFFGNATLSAIKKFQVKWDIAKGGDPGYGNLGPKTRAKLNALFGK